MPDEGVPSELESKLSDRDLLIRIDANMGAVRTDMLRNLYAIIGLMGAFIGSKFIGTDPIFYIGSVVLIFAALFGLMVALTPRFRLSLPLKVILVFVLVFIILDILDPWVVSTSAMWFHELIHSENWTGSFRLVFGSLLIVYILDRIREHPSRPKRTT